VTDLDRLDPALRLAIAWQPAVSRGALADLFRLDGRLERAVARATEPMLAQIRLAWWRDRLKDVAAGHPQAEPLLSSLAATWGRHARFLTPLVDGWESRIEGLEASDPSAGFIAGRAGAMAGFAKVAGCEAEADAAATVGRRWALHGLMPAAEICDAIPLSAHLRGLAVLDGLAVRALRRKEPMLAGRTAALLAWRLGIFGR